MKLDAVKQLSEMGATKICPKCGRGTVEGHYYYKGEWRCKKAGAAEPSSSKKAEAPQPSTPVTVPAAAKTAKTPSPNAAASPSHREQALEWLVKLTKQDPSVFTFRDDDTVDVLDPNIEIYLDDMHVHQFPVKWGKVAGGFLCSGGILKTLENGPTEVGGEWHCNHNALTSLIHGPVSVGSECVYTENPITSLEGLPAKVGGGVHLDGCPNLKSLTNIHKYLKQMKGILSLQNTKIESNMLGVLLIKGLEAVTCPSDLSKVEDILNKHLKGERDMIMCQQELLDAGFPQYAKL